MAFFLYYVVFVDIFNALAELFQPLLNAIGLGKHHGDERLRKLPFSGVRNTIRERIAIGRAGRMQAEQARAMSAQAKRMIAQRQGTQKARLQKLPQNPVFQKRKMRL